MTEPDYELEKTKIHLDFLQNIILEKYRMFTLVTAVSIAALAFFSSQHEKIEFYPRLLITGFILLAIISPLLLFYELWKTETKYIKRFQTSLENIKKKNSNLESLLTFGPHFVLFVYTLLMILTLCYLWDFQFCLTKV